MQASPYNWAPKINPQFYWGSGETEQGYKKDGRAKSKPKEKY